jgi:hypothetical protein
MASLKGISLSLLIGPGLPLPVPDAVAAELESVQVTEASGARAGFQIVFRLSRNGLLRTTLLPAGYLDPQVRVLVVATINGMPVTLSDGAIIRQDMTPGARPGETKLTISGEDVSHYMDLIELDGLPYPAQPEVARVLQIMARYAWLGMIPAPIPPVFMDVPVPIERIPQQKGTDYAYVKLLAEQHGYTFFVTPGPAPGTNIAYWGPEIRTGIPQPALTVDSGTATNVENLSFAFNGAEATLYLLTVVEPISKVPIPIPVPNVSLLRPPLAARPALPQKLQRLQTARLNPLQAVARGLAATGQAADPATATGALDVATYGRPLRARGLVGVRGAGHNDGLWYVRSVTHTLKRGEYKQSFSLARDGFISTLPRLVA